MRKCFWNIYLFQNGWKSERHIAFGLQSSWKLFFSVRHSDWQLWESCQSEQCFIGPNFQVIKECNRIILYWGVLNEQLSFIFPSLDFPFIFFPLLYIYASVPTFLWNWFYFTSFQLKTIFFLHLIHVKDIDLLSC
jgi:hypothetical protein